MEAPKLVANYRENDTLKSPFRSGFEIKSVNVAD
jgi:hypothetical protein